MQEGMDTWTLQQSTKASCNSGAGSLRSWLQSLTAEAKGGVRKCRDSAHGCETIPFDVSCRPLDDDTHKARSISFSPHLHENHVKSLHWQAFGLGVKGVAAATHPSNRQNCQNWCCICLDSIKDIAKLLDTTLLAGFHTGFSALGRTYREHSAFVWNCRQLNWFQKDDR